MQKRQRHIVALGGGGLVSGVGRKRIADFIFSLTGKRSPRICFLPTAQGDSDLAVRRFYRAAETLRCRPSHLGLFHHNVADTRKFLLSQDVIYVAGGNTANMLAIWRVQGIDKTLGEAWRRGVVLAGASAGAICWFQGCTTDSFGGIKPLRDGLGFLAGSFCPHYDAEKNRRPTYLRMVRTGQLPAGFALDDCVGLHYVGARLVEAISSRRGGRAFRVEVRAGRAVEEALPVRYLGPSVR